VEVALTRSAMPRLLPDAHGLPRSFWLLWAGMLVNRLGTFVGPFLALYLTSRRGLPVETAGAVVSLVGLGSLGSGPTGGYLADRLGRRTALGLTTVLGAGAMLAMGTARSLSSIGAAAAALGFFGELHRPAAAALVADIVAVDDRARAYSLVYWAVNLGVAIALPVAGLIANRSYAALFVGDAFTTLAFGALVFATISDSRVTTPDDARQPHYLRPYRDRPFLGFAALTFVVAFVFFQHGVTVPLEMVHHGLSPRTYGWLIAINGGLIVLVQPAVGPLTQRMPRGRVLAAGALLIGTGIAMTGLARGQVILYALSIVVWTAGEMAFLPIAATFVSDLAPAELRGSYQGAYQITWGAAAFLAPLVGGLVLGRLGPAVLWPACAVAGMAGAAAARRVRSIVAAAPSERSLELDPGPLVGPQ
jgi:MFS family permease